MKTVYGIGLTALLGATLALAPGAASAEDDTGWKDVAELSYVLTSGNSETSSFGFKNTLSRSWDSSSVKIGAGGVRVETTTTTFTNTTAGLTEVDKSDTTAESYYLRGRFDRKISEKFFWFTGAGWERNRFSGIKNRYTGYAGVGNVWIDNDDVHFSTDYALSFTDQEDVTPAPSMVDDTFLGARLSWDYSNKFGKNAVYDNQLVFDENLDETSDWRAEMDQSISVSMTEKLALKVGLLLLYDNEPSFTTSGAIAPAVPIPVQLDEMDTVFTASLVINFR